jgi:hypothetical protein
MSETGKWRVKQRLLNRPQRQGLNTSLDDHLVQREVASIKRLVAI